MLPGGRGHRRTSTLGGGWAKQAELANAYSALAAELTRTEIKSLGGYSLGRVIGEGSFGKVRLGVHRLTGTRVAVKQVPKSLPGGSSSDPSSPLSLLTRELHHHRRLRHPHLLTLYELLATESSIYLVTELCAGGELFDYLVEHGRLSLNETRRIFGQLCLGVAYLHGEGVVHRDLKLENVLLDEEVNVKIADLGFARETESGAGGGKWLETHVGTVGYSAPEVIRGEKYLGEQIDIWSLGVILYALVTGSLPFDDDDEQVMRELILKGEYEMPSWLDGDVASLIRLILVPNPSQRPSLHAILSHPFFTRTSEPDPAPSLPIPMATSGSISSTDGANLAAPYGNGALYGSALSSSSSLASVAPLGRDASHFPSPIPENASPSPASPAARPPEEDAPLPVSASTVSAVENFGTGGRTEAGGGEDGEMSEVKAGKRRAVEFAGEDDDDAGDRLDTLPPSRPVHSPFRPRRPSSSSLDYTAAPPLQRTTSTGAASIVSTHSHSLTPHTPHARTPLRTKRRSVGSIISERLVSLHEDLEDIVPSSTSPSPFSAPPPPAARVDYLALLTLPRQPPLSTPAEKALLDSLSTLGMDAGQVTHSVSTHACDSCAAIWWMLKRKADERELERIRIEEMEAAEGGLVGAPLSRTSSLRSLRGGYGGTTRRGSMRGREEALPEEDDATDEGDQGMRPPPSPLRVEEYPLLPPVAANPPRRPRTPSPPSAVAALPPPIGTPQTPSSRRPSADPSTPSSSRRPSAAPTTPSVTVHAAPSSDAGSAGSAERDDSDARLDYFLQYPPGSQSAPLLSYFPTVVDPASPSRNRTMPRSKSKDHLSSHPVVSPKPSPGVSEGLSSPTPHFVPLGSPLSPGGNASTDEGPKKARNRAGSTGMLLARATSALGTGLALMKPGGGSEAGTPSTPSGTEEDPFIATGGGKSIFAPRKSSLPTDDPRLVSPAPSSSPPLHPHPGHTSLPPSPKKPRNDEAPLQPSPSRPPLIPSSSSAAAPAQGSPAPSSASAALASVPPTPSPSLSGAGSHETFATTVSSSKSSGRDTAPAPAPAPTRPTSLSSLSALGSSGSKRSLKGGNLLNTFKHWFGDGQRKRKRASMMPRLGGSDPGGIPQIGSAGYNAAAGLNRSQSLYVGSPLRRPPMGSRRSSNQSLAAAAAAQAGGAAGGTLSRRSSVSSAHRAPVDFTPGRPVALGHARRPSSDSRASFASERDHSRPASLRSFSGQPGSSARKRHSKAASSSSTGSHATSMGKEAIYRRPPTTTTVRRRQGSHGRYGSHTHGHGHRRTTSGTTSASHRSSLSDADASGSAAEDDLDFEDEPPVAAAVIEEEDEGTQEDGEMIVEAVKTEEPDEDTRMAARARALRTLSGEPTTPPHPSSKPNSVHSASSSQHHHPRPYQASTFTAHKSTHLFGSPSQPHAPSTASLARRAPPPPRPPLRDVFASARSPDNEYGEWIDEDDELAGYGGGLGQGRVEMAGASSSSTAAGLGLSSGGLELSAAAPADSPVADRVWAGGAGKFASRYAGVDGGAGTGGRTMPVSRPAALIEEEEEEEDEE
ncbi:hypothetical protein JCM6882_005106 [Rhodosporidiobolus microsporus]